MGSTHPFREAKARDRRPWRVNGRDRIGANLGGRRRWTHPCRPSPDRADHGTIGISSDRLARVDGAYGEGAG